MDTWEGDECNQYVGTDSTIFPPYMTKDEGISSCSFGFFSLILTHFLGIWAYEPSICRSLGATYKGKATYSGLPLSRFEMELGSSVNQKDCFCRNPGECPIKGTIDLYHCSGSPMLASHPHFYLGDPILGDKIASGLNPNKEEHGIFLLFELVCNLVQSFEAI